MQFLTNINLNGYVYFYDMEHLQFFEYPVKGLRGHGVCCATVSRRGLNHDRRWMLVDEENSFLSQRQLPQLTRFVPELTENLLIRHTVDGDLFTAPIASFTEPEEVEVWGQVVTAHRSECGVDAWFSNLLGCSVKLVHMLDSDIRPIKDGKKSDIVSFADGYPALLTGSASLDKLNENLEKKIGIDRFRPNIHVPTMIPFEEDAWKRLKIGAVRFRVIKRSARCHVVNVDQQLGRASREPLRTLNTFRKEGNKVYFGVNLIPENEGIIHETDKIKILS